MIPSQIDWNWVLSPESAHSVLPITFPWALSSHLLLSLLLRLDLSRKGFPYVFTGTSWMGPEVELRGQSGVSLSLMTRQMGGRKRPWRPPLWLAGPHRCQGIRLSLSLPHCFRAAGGLINRKNLEWVCLEVCLFVCLCICLFTSIDCESQYHFFSIVAEDGAVYGEIISISHANPQHIKTFIEYQHCMYLDPHASINICVSILTRRPANKQLFLKLCVELQYK